MQPKTTLLLFLFAALRNLAYGQPCDDEPWINFNLNTFEICPGESVTIIGSPFGTVGPVTYSWLPVGGNTNSITVSPELPTTWYYLQITDACFTVMDSVKVDINPVTITSILSTGATDCPSQTGTLGSVEVLPDSPIYTYTLTGNGAIVGPQSNNQFTNLAGGITYFLTVENVYGCTVDTTVTIDLASNAVTAAFDVAALTEIDCFGDQDGEAAISAIGGGLTPPYLVQWTNVDGLHDQTTTGVGGGDVINSLGGGWWVVSVTDMDGCAWSHLFNVDGPEQIGIDPEAQSPTCYGFSDGAVVAAISGGVGTYDVVMTDAAGTQLNIANVPEINMLVSGWYWISVTDDNGCAMMDSIFVDEPGELDIELSLAHPFCYNDASGMAVVDTIYNSLGNYADIAYYWNPNPAGSNGIGQDSCLQLTAGNYTLTINDPSGCSKVIGFDIVSITPEMYFLELGSEPWSNAMDGVVYASAAGGTPPYTYTWTDLATGNTNNNTTWGGLQPGDYQLEVVDLNGCVLLDVVSIGYLSAGQIENDAVKLFSGTDGHVRYSNSLNREIEVVLYNLAGEKVYRGVLPAAASGALPELRTGAYLYYVSDGDEAILLCGKIMIFQ